MGCPVAWVSSWKTLLYHCSGIWYRSRPGDPDLVGAGYVVGGLVDVLEGVELGPVGHVPDDGFRLLDGAWHFTRLWGGV